MPAANQAAVHTGVGPGVSGGRWPWSWPLLSQPPALVAYLLAVTGCDLGLLGFEASRTVIRPGQMLLFVALLACGAACIEGTRRLGMPAGVSRDLLSAWWLPVALLLPPLYALVAPIPLTILLQFRVRRAVVFRRVFSAAALGVAGAAASATFRLGSGVVGGASVAEPRFWSAHPAIVPTAVGAAILFSFLNATLVAVAAYTADPETRWREVLWDRERLLLDVVELCVGVLVTIACLASPLLLLVALPPVIVLQRSLLHKQLRAAARTDAKTGLLNAAAWQREADAEVGRAARAGDPLALLVLDIDHFKRVNDTHGHLIGDRVLVGLAAALRQQLRDCDVVGRFGGEEFVALLPRATVGEAYRIAERLRIRVGRMRVPVGTGDETDGAGDLGDGSAGAGPAWSAPPGSDANRAAVSSSAGDGTAALRGFAEGATAGNGMAGDGLFGPGTAGDGMGGDGLGGLETAGDGLGGRGTAGAGTAGRGTAGGGTGGNGGADGVTAGPGVGVTISIGVSVLGLHGRDMFELLAAADLALYRAKESGRDQVRLFAAGDEGTARTGRPPGPALAAAEPD
jgi:diguanylate cyclase (GGDEF)-like protein